ERHFRLGPFAQPLCLVVGQKTATASVEVRLSDTLPITPGFQRPRLRTENDGTVVVQIPPRAEPLEFSVFVSPGGMPERVATVAVDAPPQARWPEILITRGTNSTATGAYVVDNIGLPLDNPWRRNIRLTSLDFFRDGRAAAVTFDGDIWIISGLSG